MRTLKATTRLCVGLTLVMVGATGARAEPVPPVSCADLAFPGTPACRDYSGDAWTPASAGADCAAVPGAGAGTLQVGARCPANGVVGTCLVGQGTPEETALLFYGGDVTMAETSCVSYLGGIWSTPAVGRCDHGLVMGPPGTPPMSVCTAYPGAGWDEAAAAAHCAALDGGSFTAGSPCEQATVGVCTLAAGAPEEWAIHFDTGDVALLAAGCEGTPPFGLGGGWSAAVAPTLPPAVVAALRGDAEVSVTPDACLDEGCLADLVAVGGALEFTPTTGLATRGLVLYPGGLVEPRAYAVAARALAARGYVVAIVPFPGNLPIADPMRGLPVLLAHPEVEHWAVGGHSLGGVAAAILASADPLQRIRGLALWASYLPPGMDLAESALKIVNITATEDGILDWDAWQAGQGRLPATGTRHALLRGGNHAQFGDYGDQAGDGVAAISREHQHALVVGATAHLLARLGLSAEQDVELPLYGALPDETDALCARAQRELAGFRRRDLPLAAVVNTTYPLESAFVASKPGFPVAGEALVAVTTHVHQQPNPADVTAPPVVDGEVWCKLKTQESIAVRYELRPRWEEGECQRVNEQLLWWALGQVELPTLIRFLLGGARVVFDEDVATASGPEWLGRDVTVDDLGADTWAVQSPHLWTPLVVPPPYDGNYYCKVWSPFAAVRFVLQRGHWSWE